ncbi:MAG: PAS/PAC sensor-containing diguanylate cyclase/phosphodiesterase [bacterium]|nr:MAG: PAS/PAC sensor-containing diguanylate cyclase/phosphodiesterase [bacterium]KAF0147769.1 MAG: PAS/PAC sensor-containing diguanylate cyclase/phosphodiesterase [bacterium]KAF0167850.1 MAG: PAS/PAC sensor-containing diguanylate cyclase/phosphodiesterase [bacterium]TXT19864.1 MAG: PAS/PAC sensor-containing diguanylate cyclase/phosphodiesterase [bacterium]
MTSRDHARMVWLGSLLWTLVVWGSGIWTYQRLHAEITIQAMDRMGLDLGLLHLATWLLGMLFIHRIGRWLELRFLAQQSLIENLQTREGRDSRALRATKFGVWDLDLRTGEIYHSAGMAEMLGYSQAVLPAQPAAWQALTHPDDLARAESALQAHLRGESPRYEAVLRVRGHHHAWQWILVRGRALRDKQGQAIRVLGTHTEITELKEREEQLRAENERARITLSSIGDAVITTDMEGNVSFMNPVAETLTGWKLDESQGMPVEAVVMVMDEATRKPAPHPVTLCRSQGGKVSLREGAYLMTRNGGEIAIQDSAAPILDQAGQPVGVVMVFHDVTEARALARQMSWQARHDVLTGLFSRREFERRLADLVEDARHVGSRHALLYMDLDNFKVVNDTCGHAAGDELLKQVAFLLSEPMRKNDSLARLGGDEFGVLLENCPLQRARDIADKLLGALSAFRFVWGAHSFDVAGSIGIAVIDAEAGDAGALLSAADVACYAAKDAGRNRAHVYEKQSDQDIPHRLNARESSGTTQLWSGQAACAGNDPGGDLNAKTLRRGRRHQASMISKSWVISAVLPRMMLAEQYFSADSLMARSTTSGLRPRPRTVKCMWILVNTFG